MRPRGPGDAFEKRRGEVERWQAGESQYFKVTGEIEVTQPGESGIAVNFPCLFVEKPYFSFGFELGPGQPTVIGSFPTGHIVVVLWHERVRDDETVIYTGATFGIITSGPASQVMIAQWHMEGVGLQSPVPEKN